MYTIRSSVQEDIPAIRALWNMAFGDGDEYIDNFFRTCYRPERVLVLTEGRDLLSMTTWFDTTLSLPGGGEFRAAYLYAVATRTEMRGKGLSSQLLAWADDYLRERGFPLVTTVPAEPSLHTFFGRNGFREGFYTAQEELPADGAETAPFPLRPVDAVRYGRLRELLLERTPHVAYSTEALRYQEGCCALSGGGLFAGEAAGGPACLCAERMGNGTVVVKELLGSPEARRQVLSGLFRALPGPGAIVRTPAERISGAVPFGMLKWLDREEEQAWDAHDPAYLGLAFD